jgi:hypothetical protein
LAPDAHLHAGVLVVPAGTGIRVRSYDPTRGGEAPSSPWSAPAASIEAASTARPGRIVNLSSKANLSGEGAALIIGFVVQDAPAKRYLIRAIGPGLGSFGEAAPLADPRLVVAAAGGMELVANQGWQGDAAAGQLPALAQSVGAFPLAVDANDAATSLTAAAGNFTVHITSASALSGAVLGELYELERAGRTANVSIRGRTTREQPLTGGFVIAGGTNRILIRAIGPTLREFGVADAIGDPGIMLRAGNAVIATNDGGPTGATAMTVENATARAGAFPLTAGSRDAALVASLPAGNYTVEVKPGTVAGSVLLEIYDVP